MSPGERPFSLKFTVYVGYLVFQLWSHTHLYNDQHNKKSNRLSATFREKRTRRKQKHTAAALGMPLMQTESLPDLLHHRHQHHGQSQSLDALPLNPPRRPFAASTISSRSSHSDITLSSRTESVTPSRMEKAPYLNFSSNRLRSGSTSRMVSSELSMGGYPMTRDNNSSGLSSNSTVYNHEGEPTLMAVEMDESDLPSANFGSKKEPQLSWFLTIFLLVVVTGVC
jgi:Ca2+:H+ antiporter